ncbi:MAG: LysR family transcriptional regulator [Caulobacteraceae bacterium]
MDSRDWIILKTIKEERSLSRTAERLYISQPSLTYRLNNLEKELGVKILDRHSNGVSFTYQGEYVLKYAEEMLERLALVKEKVKNMRNPVWGTLRLGVSSVYAKFKIAPILKTYRLRFPDVEVILKTGSSTSQLPDMLQKNDVDIVIVRGDIDWPEGKHVILEEPHGIISAYPIELNQLPDIPLIMDDTVVTTKFDEVFYSWWNEHFSAPPPSNIIKVDTLETCIQLASHGLGWTVAPKIHIGNRRSLFFCPMLWANGQPVMQKTVMAYRNAALEQPAAKMFVDYILNECLTHL